MGVGPGRRVATLAWNTQAHVEVWYGVMGLGAVCHTLNPRLTEAQLADMVAQSEAFILVVSADLEPWRAGSPGAPSRWTESWSSTRWATSPARRAPPCWRR